MYTDRKIIFDTMETKITKILSSETSNKMFKIVGHFILVVFLTSIIHWFLVGFYASKCVDPSWMGMLKNMINLGSPFCQFINYIQYEISKYYVTIWASAGLGIIAYFITNNEK